MERQPLLNSNSDAYSNPCWGDFIETLGTCVGFSCLFACCGCACNPYRTVNAGHRGVITRFGRIRDVVQPGMVYVNPISEQLVTVDIRTHVKSLESQEVMTKDNLPLTIDGDVYWHRTDAVMSTYNVVDLTYCIDQIAHAALRDVFGHYDLNDCLTHREEVSLQMQRMVADRVKGWGVVIENVLVRDIRVPNHIRDLLASGATARREADALIIKAEANVRSSKLLREAADQLSTPAAMQIRSLETIERLANSENARLVFLPIDGKIQPNVNVSDLLK